MLSLTLETQASAEVEALILALDGELAGPYTAEQHHGFSLEAIFSPGMRFFVARLDAEAVGCGGVAFDDGFAEVKRMYVKPRARGLRVAQAILDRLELEAQQHGFRRLMLETGDVQHAAIKVYERAGFSRCAAFGDYTAMDAHMTERSVFFEKKI